MQSPDFLFWHTGCIIFTGHEHSASNISNGEGGHDETERTLALRTCHCGTSCDLTPGKCGGPGGAPHRASSPAARSRHCASRTYLGSRILGVGTRQVSLEAGEMDRGTPGVDLDGREVGARSRRVVAPRRILAQTLKIPLFHRSTRVPAIHRRHRSPVTQDHLFVRQAVGRESPHREEEGRTLTHGIRTRPGSRQPE